MPRKILSDAVGKRCPRCEAHKAWDDFSPGTKLGGKQSWCKACCSTYYHKRYPAEVRQIISRRTRLKNLSSHVLRGAKSRARDRGTPFSITAADIRIPTHCPILGIELVVGIGAPTASSPSLDAIIPKLGYVPGNVWVISQLANRMKNDATPEQLNQFAQWILSESAEVFSEQRAQLKAVA